MLYLNGCAAPLALTLLGVGAGVTTGTAVSYTMDGIAYRTFTAPLPQVERATLGALNEMGMEVDGAEKTDEGKIDKGQGRRPSDRDRTAGRKLQDDSNPHGCQGRDIFQGPSHRYGNHFADRKNSEQSVDRKRRLLCKDVSHFFSMAVSLLMIASAPALSFAQTTSASSTPATNISNDYSYFLKNVNSQQVVNDLRNGQWTTTTTDPNTNSDDDDHRSHFQPGRWDSEM